MHIHSAATIIKLHRKNKRTLYFHNPPCSAHSYLHEHNLTEKEREEEEDWELEGDHMRPRQQ